MGWDSFVGIVLVLEPGAESLQGAVGTAPATVVEIVL